MRDVLLGLYKALSFYHGTERGYAPQALAKAVRLEKHAGKRERLYIEATAAIEKEREHPARSERLSKSIALWRKVIKDYPNDTESRFCLWSLVNRKEGVALVHRF